MKRFSGKTFWALISASVLSGGFAMGVDVPVHAQTSLWYSNNFGASAEDHFPVLRPELQSTAFFPADGDATITLDKEDVDFLLGGRIRQEGQMFKRPLTFRDDYNDLYAFVRSKLNLDINTQYGRRTYGTPAVQMGMRLTAFSIWDDPYLYTPVLEEKVYVHGTNFLKKAELSAHHHRGIVPLFFLEEGWMKINFDSFLEGLSVPVSLQVGTFPFIVGRGVSLGSYFEGGSEYLGFERKGDIGNAPQKPNGILLTVGVGENGMLEFYYSKSRKRSHGPDWTREEVKARRLDRDELQDPRAIERGQNGDNDIFAARFGYNALLSGGEASVYLEPYGVLLDARELKVEFDADSSLRQGTIGIMGEYSWKNISINCEAAIQYGQQTMHPIDRNHLVIDDAYYTQTATAFANDGSGNAVVPSSSAVAGRLDKQIGYPVKYQSHVFLGAAVDSDSPETTTEYLPYRAYYVSDEMQHINAHRSIAEQGGKVRTAAPTEATDDFISGNVYTSQKQKYDTTTYRNGSLYSQYQFKTGVDYYDTVFGLLGTAPNGILYNANLPFAGQQRFRDKYVVTNMGVMAMFDIRYAMPDKWMNVSAALGFVGGDKYPFQPNEEKEKRLSHFMPLRDSDYVGRYVTSFAMLYPRKIPRPLDMSDNDLFAHNDYKTMQNIQYVGLGSQWFPLHDKTLMLEGNALYFWQVVAPHVWNSNRPRTFENNSKPDKEDSLYRYIQRNELHFSGSATEMRASKALGLELNMVLSWRPYQSLQFDLRAGLFLPGKLYDDIQGCPNINTRRIDEKGEWHHDSLGTQMVSGGQARVTYRF